MRDAGGGERAGERRADGGVDVAVLVAVDARRRAADVLEPRELRARLGRRLRRHHRARVARLAEAEFSAEAGFGPAEPGALLVGVAAVEEERRHLRRAEQRPPLRQVEVEPEAAEEAALARELYARLRRRAVHHHRRERDDARLHRVEDAEVALLGDAEVVGDDD